MYATWCEGSLQLEDIGTKNVSEPDLTPRMKYIMVRLETETEHFYKKGDRIHDSLWKNSSVLLD